MALPVVLVLLVGSGAVLFAEILLHVPRLLAVAIALMSALNLLAAFSYASYASARRGGGRPQRLLAFGVAAVPVLVGMLVAAGLIPVRSTAGVKKREVVLELTARNIAFDRTELRVPPDRTVILRFHNADAVPHNVVIFAGPDASAPPLFRGEIFTGPKTVDYRFESPSVGSYLFHCDVHHAQMFGTLVVSEASPGA